MLIYANILRSCHQPWFQLIMLFALQHVQNCLYNVRTALILYCVSLFLDQTEKPIGYLVLCPISQILGDQTPSLAIFLISFQQLDVLFWAPRPSVQTQIQMIGPLLFALFTRSHLEFLMKSRIQDLGDFAPSGIAFNRQNLEQLLLYRRPCARFQGPRAPDFSSFYETLLGSLRNLSRYWHKVAYSEAVPIQVVSLTVLITHIHELLDLSNGPDSIILGSISSCIIIYRVGRPIKPDAV